MYVETVKVPINKLETFHDTLIKGQQIWGISMIRSYQPVARYRNIGRVKAGQIFILILYRRWILCRHLWRICIRMVIHWVRL